MPRLAFEEPKGGPLAPAEPTDEEQVESPEDESPDADSTMVLLKAATVAVALALVATVVLLTTSGKDEPAARAPHVPQIGTSGVPNGPTSSTPAFVVPPVHTQSAEMTVTPPPVVTQPTVPTDDAPPNQFVRIGEPCDAEGAYAFTESFQPAVCDRRRGTPELTWRPIFR
ncbi:hypothetical protein [Actinophytocola sp.]|uniref:hypothetical protein n=1 Tax=Actinophytocola sp. TaxID=1872138 RepID=UPI002ED029BA